LGKEVSGIEKVVLWGPIFFKTGAQIECGWGENFLSFKIFLLREGEGRLHSSPRRGRKKKGAPPLKKRPPTSPRVWGGPPPKINIDAAAQPQRRGRY